MLARRLRPVLERLNLDVLEDAFDQAVEELVRDRNAMAPAQANREIGLLLKNGVRVKIPAPDGEGETLESVRECQKFRVWLISTTDLLAILAPRHGCRRSTTEGHRDFNQPFHERLRTTHYRCDA